ncbi:EAL domain-containing protein [Sulfuritalea sp.]|uniref:EAL domain-containing protein n=1 Tax=Sulfuritalea sp. TaxID=2480090 RepID=UPI001AC31972|nr:EAL domain-containing protein [Sulfuritalea sp.]MBN8476033.1 EAL domain-containing protein [Sulfuritalea sp.]
MPDFPVLTTSLRRLGLVFCILQQAGPAFAAQPGGAPVAAEPLRIGVLAFRGPERARAEWQAHAEFLESKLAPRRFSIVPLTLDEFGPAIAQRRIDLAITNSGHYVALESGGRISHIATMRTAGPQGPVGRFGGVAIARAGRDDLKTYADLRGKRVAVPDVKGFGGWQVHLREARHAGIELARDLGGVIELRSQDNVIESVLDGTADAGFIRSDLIENLTAAGALDPSRLQVISPRQTANFPYQHSTQLYPQWPFARLDHVSEELARDLLIALLDMRPEHPAARAAGIHGWTLPQNYQSIHDLFLEFRLEPYADLPVELSDAIARYGKPLFLAAASIISLLLAALWYIAVSNTALRRSKERLQLAAGVFEHAQEGIMITDSSGAVIDANDTFLALTGYSRDEVLGRNPRFLSSGEQRPEFYREMWDNLLRTGFWRGELVNRRKDGSLYVQQTSISAVRDRRGRIRHFIGLSSDVSALRESQKRLEQMAYFDTLTGLPNRRMLSDRLYQAIAQARRSEKLLAVCYLDLDEFKAINDTWGHAAGDTLLVEASRRLQARVRAGDTVSRMGGDEFVLLLGSLTSFEECEIALERIRDAMVRPFFLREGEARVSCSMGVTLYPLDGDDPDMLLRHADQAMYLAKQGGRNRFTLFDAEHDRISEMRRESRRAVQDAMGKDQLVLYFQPQVNMRSGQVVGAEALVRWQHPERGLLDPGEFMSTVELVGLHAPLGGWILSNAIRQYEAWSMGNRDLKLSVNIAAEQLHTDGFVENLRELLARHPAVAAHRLELEVLETTALDDLAKVSRVIEDCRALGISFAIDDFGTGYSSLSYLKQLRADTLKIDQSFIRDMLADPDDLSIVDSIVGLAAAFRRNVIAEGVESIRHGRLLLQLGCELAQGYAIARPMPAGELPSWIAAWRQPPEWRDVPIWPREDLPLLTVEIDHLCWTSQLEATIKSPPGHTAPSPPLDPHACRFGHWLDLSGRDRYGSYASFQHVEQAHERVHAVGCEIDRLAREDREAARRQFSDLYAPRDELLQALARLREEVQSGRV